MTIHAPLQGTRACLLISAACIAAACGTRTPQCADAQVVARVEQLAAASIEEGLVRFDPEVKLEPVLSRIDIAVASALSTAYDKAIDKWTCSAQLRVGLPAQIAAMHAHPAFKAAAIPKLEVHFQGNDLVTPITYTVYRSQDEKQLIVNAEGLDVPARYVRGAYRVGAFTADLNTAPDLRAGLTLYSAQGKHLLIRPTDDGRLQFHASYDNPMCRPWTQNITAERDNTLIYRNEAAGCAATFSLLGELLLVAHEGCSLMVQSCLPDGVYRKR